MVKSNCKKSCKKDNKSLYCKVPSKKVTTSVKKKVAPKKTFIDFVYSDIINILHAIRRDKKISQKVISKNLKVSLNTIGSLENEKRGAILSLKQFLIYCNELEISPADVINEAVKFVIEEARVPSKKSTKK